MTVYYKSKEKAKLIQEELDKIGIKGNLKDFVMHNLDDFLRLLPENSRYADEANYDKCIFILQETLDRLSFENGYSEQFYNQKQYSFTYLKLELLDVYQHLLKAYYYFENRELEAMRK